MNLPNHEETKHSFSRLGVIAAYAANTNQGIFRSNNQDRISIVVNMLVRDQQNHNNTTSIYQPKKMQKKCSFFGIYDGHAGVGCAEFLKNNLHQFIIQEPSFPNNPREAILKGFAHAEKLFLSQAQNAQTNIFDHSGSCALILLILDQMCYIANLGDSRAIMSSQQGKQVILLSRDHKPQDEYEYYRIIKAKGNVYSTSQPQNPKADPNNQVYRIYPGRLSVARTIGDAEAKLTKFGGNPNAVIAMPDIKQFCLKSEYDFIILGSDGIFDKLSNAETIHEQVTVCIESVMKAAILKRSLDNISCVGVFFQSFELLIARIAQTTINYSFNLNHTVVNKFREVQKIKLQNNQNYFHCRKNSQNQEKEEKEQQNDELKLEKQEESQDQTKIENILNQNQHPYIPIQIKQNFNIKKESSSQLGEKAFPRFRFKFSRQQAAPQETSSNNKNL